MDDIIGGLGEGLSAAGPGGVILILITAFWLLARGDLRFGREYNALQRRLDEVLEELKQERNERRADRRLARTAVADVERVAELASDAN